MGKYLSSDQILWIRVNLPTLQVLSNGQLPGFDGTLAATVFIVISDRHPRSPSTIENCIVTWSGKPW
ncbi:MAG: hypothetical protein F6K44_02140 [Moorea sp. SIO3E2]|uniref:Uncharacterized protein n=1 Tax=Moorena producens (strain JHB) TaxID=1454205 RepID=A0A1D9G7E1_MOOP1|nr:hypothetical protein [Moorena sp. SIO3E2]